MTDVLSTPIRLMLSIVKSKGKTVVNKDKKNKYIETVGDSEKMAEVPPLNTWPLDRLIKIGQKQPFQLHLH